MTANTPLLEPKEIEIPVAAGGTKKFIISKMPYASGGREVCTQFIPSGMPKVGDYAANERLMLKMMSFIEVQTSEGTYQRLTTPALVDNHVTDFQMGIRLEKEMLEYNFGFFDQGKIYAFLKTLGQKHLASILPTLTEFLGQLSQKVEPPSKN